MPVLGTPLGFPFGTVSTATTTVVPAAPAAIADAALPARDIKLNADGDWDMSGGDLNFSRGLDSIRQDAQMRMSFILGEWFLDEGAGLPWLGDVLGGDKNPNLPAVRAMIRDELLATDGITDVTQLATDFDPVTRVLTVTWQASTDLGIIDGSTDLGAAA